MQTGTGNTLKLFKYVAGVQSTIINQSFQFANSTEYQIDLNRNIDGNFNFAIDNNISLRGGKDTTYTDFNFLTMHGNTNTNGRSLTVNDIKLTSFHDAYNSVIHSLNNLGSQTVCLTIREFNSSINTGCTTFNVSGDLNIQMRDENTLSPATGLNVTLNGTSISQNVDGSLSFDMNSLSGNNVFTAYSATYPLRTWRITADFNTNKDLNFMVLNSTKGSNIKFYFRDVNGIVMGDSNLNIVIRKTGLSGSDYNVTSFLLDHNGFTTLFLNGNPLDDGDYRFILNRPGKIIDYTTSIVTVGIPVLESNTARSITPYNLSLTGLSGFNIAQTSSTTSVSILSNTINYYNFFLDINTDFYPRSYGIRTQGGANLALTPYMNLKNESSTIALFFVNKNNRTERLPGIFVEILRNIPGTGNATMQSAESDATGTFNGSFLTSVRYNIRVTQDFNQICNFNTPDPCLLEFIPTISTNEIALDLTEIDLNTDHMSIIVNFSPNNGVLDVNSTGDYNFTIDINAFYSRIVTVTVYNGINVIATSTLLTGGIGYNQTYFVYIPGTTVDTLAGIKLVVYANGIDGNQTFSQDYVIQIDNSIFSGFFKTLRGLNSVAGYPVLTIISIVLSIIVMVMFGFTTGSSGLAILALWGMLGIFTFIFTWIPYPGFILGLIAGVAGFLWTERRG